MDSSDELHGSRSGKRRKWRAIITFVALPWLLMYGLIFLVPALPSEPALKEAAIRLRPAIDTVVVGDSRAATLSEDEFAREGWHYFNMAMSGTCAEDLAMQLKYALNTMKIRRVVMTATFESMTEDYPFEQSRYYNDPLFRRGGVYDFAVAAAGHAPKAGLDSISFKQRLLQAIDVQPRAAERLHYLMDVCGLVKLQPYFLPNGNAANSQIQQQIARGDYPYDRHRNPKIFFDRRDSLVRYVESPRLAPHVKTLYALLFKMLRNEGIPCVVFETPRISAYQRLIDSNSTLVSLQEEWRDFYRKEGHGCVRFLSAASLSNCWNENDFFDAVHYLGPSAHGMSGRLASELRDLERQSNGSAESPVGAGGR